MEIVKIHPLHVDKEKFELIQDCLSEGISLENNFSKSDITCCAGVDVAYIEKQNAQWGICSIVVLHYKTKKIIEKVSSIDKVTVPYVPGYLAFRELPIILKAAQKLSSIPDVFMFDGNGYLHHKHMGIATHASFFLNKPTIGTAKSYFKINSTNFTMPKNETGAYEDIVIDNKIYGRVLRTHQNVKPIFISCGNYIDLKMTTEITRSLVNHVSRLPIPVRFADLESKQLKRKYEMNL